MNLFIKAFFENCLLYLRNFYKIQTIFIIIAITVIQIQSQAIDPISSEVDLIDGYRLIQVSEVTSLGGRAYQYEHILSGARILYLSNRDKNKYFTIGFKTPPNSNTGLPHILEHSVLNGSVDFPTREPFVVLLKGSLATFINAMTFADKTIYPVGSRNDEDLKNLMTVYLDAVFFPNLLNDPLILAQEGWHYEVDPVNGGLSYNGVVFNEMKGAYSNPFHLLVSEVNRALFPDTFYRFDSGGDPQYIPKLDQETFVRFHREHYHPSNSYIIFYGNGDRKNQLEFLQNRFLNRFERRSINIETPFQRSIEIPQTRYSYYSVSPQDSKEGKTILSTSYSVGSVLEYETVMGLYILNQLLLGTESSPLKRALMQSKIGSEVFGYLEAEVFQPVFSICVTGSDPEKLTEFQTTVRKTLELIAENDFDSELIDAIFNRVEFNLRESSLAVARGSDVTRNVLASWIHGGDPLGNLHEEKYIDAIRKKVKRGYFSKLIRKFLLDNSHQVTVVLEPSPGLNANKEKVIRDELASFRQSLSAKELQKIKDKQELLTRRQNTPDTEEILSRIPSLRLSDITPQKDLIPSNLISIGPTQVIQHPIFTNEVSYVKLYFDLSYVPEDKLPLLTLLTHLLSRLNTNEKSFELLSNAIKKELGGMGFSIEVIPQKNSPDQFKALLVVSVKALTKKLEPMYRLVHEVLLKTQFTDLDRIREILKENKSQYEMELSSNGLEFAKKRSKAYYSNDGKLSELLGGLSQFEYIRQLEENFQIQNKQLAQDLQLLQTLVFTRENVVLSHTADSLEIESGLPLTAQFLDQLPSSRAQDKKQNWTFSNMKFNPPEAVVIPASVQAISQAGRIDTSGNNLGAWTVLSHILSLSHLWNEVRAKGGAYGSRLRVNQSGDFSAISYRDPQLLSTLEAFSAIPGAVNDMDFSEIEFVRNKIGAYGALDKPMMPSQIGNLADLLLLSGGDGREIQRTLEEILTTTPAEIRSLATECRIILGERNISVFGTETEIISNSQLFNSILRPFSDKK